MQIYRQILSYFAVGTIFASSIALPTSAQEEVPDLLDLASGAVVLSFSSQYDEATWSALSLIDGTPKTGWSSADGKTAPNIFVIELARAYALTSFTIDNSTAQERQYPGISARGIELYTSPQGPEGPWQRLLAAEAPKGQRKTFPLSTEIATQWLKLVVTSNWGHGQFTEIMELDATGSPAGPPPTPSSVSGVYTTNYNLLYVRQKNGLVTGCYDWDDGVLNGASDGRVIFFEWRQPGPQVGTAIMVLSSSGDQLNGLWYVHGELKGTWYGPRAEKGVQPKCKAPGQQGLARSLEQAGQAIVYGIYFDHDSANIRLESEPTLDQIRDLLRDKPEYHLMIEGHTDSTGNEAYNRNLSNKRAQSVVAWLKDQGVTADRLSATGKGESEPVADNHSPQGRALNRRVMLKTAN